MKKMRTAILVPAACLLMLGACSPDRPDPAVQEENADGQGEGAAGSGTTGENTGTGGSEGQEAGESGDSEPDDGESAETGGADDGESEEAGQPDGGEDPAGHRAHLLSEIRKQVEAAADMDPALPDVLAPDGKYLGAAVDAEADRYQVTYYLTDQPLELNAKELDGLPHEAVAEARIYESPGSAKSNVGYEQEPGGKGNINLGYGISGFKDAGAGSVFLTWHEGKWSFSMRNRNIDNPGGGDEMTALAKKVVAKLEDRMLPPPEELAAGSFDMSSDTHKLTWQRGAVLYAVTADDPLELIDLVADLYE